MCPVVRSLQFLLANRDDSCDMAVTRDDNDNSSMYCAHDLYVPCSLYSGIREGVALSVAKVPTLTGNFRTAENRIAYITFAVNCSSFEASFPAQHRVCLTPFFCCLLAFSRQLSKRTPSGPFTIKSPHSTVMFSTTSSSYQTYSLFQDQSRARGVRG